MKSETVGVAEYGALQKCPYCRGRGLEFPDSLNCGHFVIAFEIGEWSPDVCRAVCCHGFEFERSQMIAALEQLEGVVYRWSPGTSRRPQVEAFFCNDPQKATELREKFRKPSFAGVWCDACHDTCAIVEGSALRCVCCGAFCKVVEVK